MLVMYYIHYREMPDGGGVPLQNMVALRFNHGDPGNGGTVWVKAKLLQFHENYRPAFYGTWRRRSYIIQPRRPFAMDYFQLNYEIDSDDEWEEEEPGENISQSDVSRVYIIFLLRDLIVVLIFNNIVTCQISQFVTISLKRHLPHFKFCDRIIYPKLHTSNLLEK